MARNVDIPYLEPLLMHLRSDTSLEKFFTKKDFFTMPKADLSDLEGALKKDCPAPRSVWIFPGMSQAANPVRNPNCLPKALHNFNVVIVFQCIRDTFTFIKGTDNQVHLDGTFMEMSEARKALKKSIGEFNKAHNLHAVGNGFDFINWISDEMLYPEDGNTFLISSSVFQTMIL